MKKLAVFDWNGTLFNDLEASLSGANAALDLLNRPPLTAEQYQETFTFPILHFYEAHGISADEYLSRHEEVGNVFLENYEREALKCSLREGTSDFLQWLKNHDVPCMILSNHLHENVMIQLRRFGIEDLFDHVSCNTAYDAAMISGTNKQERLAAFMEKHGFSSADAFIVGDSFEEQTLARHLGLTCFSITGGCIGERRLRQGNPDYLVQGLGEIRDILSTPRIL